MGKRSSVATGKFCAFCLIVACDEEIFAKLCRLRGLFNRSRRDLRRPVSLARRLPSRRRVVGVSFYRRVEGARATFGNEFVESVSGIDESRATRGDSPDVDASFLDGGGGRARAAGIARVKLVEIGKIGKPVLDVERAPRRSPADIDYRTFREF